MKKFYYHISNTLEKDEEYLVPRSYGFNRPDEEPDNSRICTAPTVEQCFSAVSYSNDDVYSIYRTKNKVSGRAAHGVYDSKVTGERWLQRKTKFIKIGEFDLSATETPFPTSCQIYGDVKDVRIGLKDIRKFKLTKRFSKKVID